MTEKCYKCKKDENTTRLFPFRYKGKIYHVCVDCYHEELDKKDRKKP